MNSVTGVLTVKKHLADLDGMGCSPLVLKINAQEVESMEQVNYDTDDDCVDNDDLDGMGCAKIQLGGGFSIVLILNATKGQLIDQLSL